METCVSIWSSDLRVKIITAHLHQSQKWLQLINVVKIYYSLFFYSVNTAVVGVRGLHIAINSDLVVNESNFQLALLDCFFFFSEAQTHITFTDVCLLNESHAEKYEVILGKIKEKWRCWWANKYRNETKAWTNLLLSCCIQHLSE